MQRAETVYADAKEYQMHHIYSATYENDFNKLAVTGYEDVEFSTKMVSMTSSILEPNGRPTAYLCFVDPQNLGVEVPEVGSRLKVTLDLSQPTPQIPDGLIPMSDNLAHVPPADEQPQCLEYSTDGCTAKYLGR
jgi:hypothetical protein